MGALLNGTQRDITDFAAPPLNKLKWSESLHVQSTDDLHRLVCECEEVTAQKVQGPHDFKSAYWAGPSDDFEVQVCCRSLTALSPINCDGGQAAFLRRLFPDALERHPL